MNILALFAVMSPALIISVQCSDIGAFVKSAPNCSDFDFFHKMIRVLQPFEKIGAHRIKAVFQDYSNNLPVFLPQFFYQIYSDFGADLVKNRHTLG